MTRLAVLIVAVLIAVAGALAVNAQSETPATEEVVVPLGQYEFVIDGEQALTACVVERREGLDGIFVTLQLFVRLETGDVVPFASFPTRATGVLHAAHVEACFRLAPEPEG